jgi:hypothetical protein
MKLPLIAGMIILIAVVGTTYYITNLDQTYYCQDKNIVSMCFKLSSPTNSISSRCYYNETLPTKYYTCTSGWKFVKEFPNIMNNLTITGIEITKSYDENLKEVTISDNLNGEIAKVRLNTPQIYYVIPGKDRLVFEWKINSTEDYANFIKEMELYNEKNQTIDRNITYKYQTLENYEISVNDYKEVCEDSKDKNKTTGKPNQICHQELTGTHKEARTKIIWLPLNKLDLTKGEITIAGFADVYPGDNTEWIATLFNVRIEDWAKWTAVISLFNMTFDESSDLGWNTGTDNSINVTGYGGWNSQNSDCIDLNCSRINAGYGIFNPPAQYATGGWSFWIKPGTPWGSEQDIITSVGTGNQKGRFDFYLSDTGGATDVVTYQLTSDSIAYYPNCPNIPYNNWTYIYLKINATGAYCYENGTLTGSATPGGSALAFYGLTYGTFGGMGTIPWDGRFNGSLDEAKFFNVELSDTQILDIFNVEGNIVVPVVLNITGQVRDGSNNLISNATVLILDKNGNLITKIASNASGDWRYAFTNGTIINYTIVGYNPNNISQGGNAYPFFTA